MIWGGPTVCSQISKLIYVYIRAPQASHGINWLAKENQLSLGLASTLPISRFGLPLCSVVGENGME